MDKIFAWWIHLKHRLFFRLQCWLVTRCCIRHRFGPKKIELASDEVVVLCLVKNGEALVKKFIDYYAHLGVRHIVLLDNNSTDRTVEIAKTFPTVTILETKLSYKKYQHALKAYLVKKFASQRWSLCVDIDEHFDFPFSQTITLKQFISYLNSQHYTAVVSQTLDLFADAPLNQLQRPTLPLRQAYSYYDISAIRKAPLNPAHGEISNDAIKYHRGGIHDTAFGLKSIHLTKHPLIFNDGKIIPHVRAHGVRNARIADVSCVTYHYKFTADFCRKVAAVVAAESYWDNSSEYKQYQAALNANPHLNLKQNSAQKLTSTDELLQQNFIVVSPAYCAWVSRQTNHETVLTAR